MKRPLLAAAALTALSGCLSFPTTPEETRAMTRAKTVQVSRSASSVMATISRQASLCLNYHQRTQTTTVGYSPGGGMNAIFNDHYRSRVSGRSMVIEHYNPNNVGIDGYYPLVVTDVVPVGGGTQVAVYAPPLHGEFVNAIHAWAKGDTAPCPGKS